MFRLTIHSTPGRAVLKLEGRCSSAVLGELDTGWRHVTERRGEDVVVVDLCDVWQVDGAARERLARMHRDGAQLVARGCLMRELVREITESG